MGALLLALLLCASVAAAAVIQHGNLRITLLAQVEPFKLPRKGPGPDRCFHLRPRRHRQRRGSAAVAEDGRQGQPPRPAAIPRPALLRPASDPARHAPTTHWKSARTPWSARDGSGPRSSSPTSALIRPRAGSSSSTAERWQAGDLRPYLHHPALQLLIRRQLRDQADLPGPYGTELSASLPQALGNWGFVDRIKLTLRRK